MLLLADVSPLMAWVSQVHHTLPSTNIATKSRDVFPESICQCCAHITRYKHRPDRTKIHMATRNELSMEDFTIPQLKEQLRERGLKVC